MFQITILISKFINFLSKTFKKGAGYTLPGYVSLKINPNILKEVIKIFPNNVVVITGTNGKTTTSKLLNHILKKQGLKVLHNESGSNLLRGIVACVLLESDFKGRLDKDVGVLEVDELYFPKFLEAISKHNPQKNDKKYIFVLLNLSRDQLDRHFEPDIVLDKWYKAISEFKGDAKIVLDGTQKYFIPFSEKLSKEVHFFDDHAESLSNTLLEGDFNAKNVNAALLSAKILGINDKEAKNSLTDFDFAYGRGEKIEYSGKSFRLFLAKNPSSFNNNLRLFLENDFNPTTLLFLLNDNIPDGRDVSWIYDINPELLNKICDSKIIYVSGTRFLEMAIRLNYAGINISERNIQADLKNIIKNIVMDPYTKDILVLPNYSSMLEIRKILTGKSIL